MMRQFKEPKNTTLKKRVQISFSGGKTSAYMTKMLLDHFKANSPDTEVKVVFANTGREHEETLRFVERCDKEFGFNVIWLEAVVRDGVGVGTVHKVVNFETASRDGAPFESSIAKYGIPNVTFNNCTRETKLRPMTSYLRSIGWEAGTASVAVGIRADEVHRISPSSMAQGVWYPCIDAGVAKDDVREWWAQQSFNLNIPEHYGNCTSCWKKSMRKLLTIAAEAPEEFEWNARMEEQYGDRGARPKGKEGTLRTFFRGNRSTKDILAMSKQPFEPFVDDKFIPYDEEMDEHGSCGDSCEVGVDKNDFDIEPEEKFSPNHLTFNAESEMMMNTQEVLLQQPKTKYTDTMQPILDLLTRLVVALETIAAKHGNGAAPSNVIPFEVETPAEKPAPAPKGKAKAPAKEEAPKVDFEALRSECKASITALVESGRKDAAKKVLAAHGVAKLAELADEKLPDIKADLAKLEEEDLS